MHTSKCNPFVSFTQIRHVSSSPYGRTHVWKRRAPSLPNPVVPKFPQRVVRADGTSFTHWTTSPRSMIRLTRDTTNNPIWNTHLWADDQAVQDEASTTGRLGRFNRRFEGIGGAGGEQVDWMKDTGDMKLEGELVDPGQYMKKQKKTKKGDSPSEHTVDNLRSPSISLQNLSSSPPIGMAQVFLIVTVAFFILVAAIALVRVLLFPSTPDAPTQAKATGTRERERPAQSPCSEKGKDLLDVAASPKVEAHEEAADTHALDSRLTTQDPTSQISQPDARSEDISSIQSVKTGATNAWRRSYRMRTISQSSTSTITTHSSTTTTTATSDSLCSTSVPRTSVTSMISALYTSESEIDVDLDVAEEETVVYEVKRAQTQSMEVKRGVLVSWRASNASLQRDVALPTLIISESDESTEPSSDYKPNKFVHNGFLHPQSTPSIQSLTSSESSTSTVSIDLDEFPLPPKLLTSPSPSLCSTLLTVPDRHQVVEIMRRDDKRSTVDRVIMLYA
ncbi:hypothetical protein PM082_001544 [Marasmius tenuissimus]|nr:hypothetical protein PM082_001544 [Marasmius tenuissimus]